MYELIKITDTAYYIDCPAKIGIVLTDNNEACLIDSGSDKDAAKKVLKHLNANGFALRAIYNTHSHADHIGGNAYLASQTGCKIYAPSTEAAFTKHTFLEPSLLYGGYPPSDLRHKFLLAQGSDADILKDSVLPKNISAVSLTGHCPDMVGFRTDDGIFFIADALSSKETLDKYAVGYIYDVGAYLDTLEMLKNAEAESFVPSHAEPTDNITPLAQYNIDKVNEVAENILTFCREAISYETILKKLFDHYSLTMNFTQYALVGSTIRSYLAWLKDKGEVDVDISENILLWKANK